MRDAPRIRVRRKQTGVCAGAAQQAYADRRSAVTWLSVMGVGTGIRRAVLTLTSGPRDALSGAIRGKPWQGC